MRRISGGESGGARSDGAPHRQHAKEFTGCTKAETIALHKKGAVAAGAAVRGLSDGELAKTGTVFTGMPPVSAEELIKRILLGHVEAHFGSIRKTIGG